MEFFFRVLRTVQRPKVSKQDYAILRDKFLVPITLKVYVCEEEERERRSKICIGKFSARAFCSG
jgi:hypothetical protein